MPLIVEGMPQLRALLSKYGDLFEDMTPSLQAFVDATVQNATAIVPVDTGFLQSSLYGQVNSPTEAEVGATADYAGFVEYGTIKMDAQPYMEPSIEIGMQALNEDIRQRLGSLR